MPHRAGRRDLKPAQRLGLAALNEGTTNELTREQYQQLTGVSRSQAAYDLAELVETGLIERVGGGRSTRYRRATPVAELAASLDERAHSGGPGRLLRESNDVADRRRLQGRGAHRPLRGGESLRRDRLLGLAARVLANGTCRAPTACSLDPAVAALGSCRHRPRSGAVRRVRRGNPTATPRSDPRGGRSTRYAAGHGSDTSCPHCAGPAPGAADEHAHRPTEPGTGGAPGRARRATGRGERRLTGEAGNGPALDERLGPRAPAGTVGRR